VEVAFPSGLTHDFEVRDSTGRLVWQWSQGRLFTQAMQNRMVDRDETVSYSATWSPTNLRRGGDYTAIASLKSDSHPVEQRVRFSVP
jgi:Intracellular proteinase inhibitor